MKTLYRTIDGLEFYDEFDARKHEEGLLNTSVYMYNAAGHRVSNTNDAMVLLLWGKKAADYFLTLAEDLGDDTVEDNGILPEAEGVFFWDREEETYREIPLDVEDGVLAALNQLSTLYDEEKEDDEK